MAVRRTGPRRFGMPWSTLWAGFDTTAVRVSRRGGRRPGDGNIRPFPQRYRGRVILTSGRIDPWLCFSAMTDGPSAARGSTVHPGLADMTSMRRRANCHPLAWAFWKALSTGQGERVDDACQNGAVCSALPELCAVCCWQGKGPWLGCSRDRGRFGSGSHRRRRA